MRLLNRAWTLKSRIGTIASQVLVLIQCLLKATIQVKRHLVDQCLFTMTGTMKAKPIRLLDLFKYYRRLGHQTAAIQELEDEINALDPYILTKGTGWYNTWVSAVAPKPKQWLVTREQVAQISGWKPSDFDDKFMNDLNMLVRVTDMTSLNQY